MRPERGSGGNRGRSPEWGDFLLPLPRATADRIIAAGRRPAQDDNVGLWLDKLVPRRWKDGPPGREVSVWTLDRDHRTFALGQLCKRWQSRAGREAAARLGETMKALHPNAEDRRHLRAKLDGRLMVDHGRAAATETSVSFHPIWGVPRIPGSALKGITRAEMRADGAHEVDLEGVFGGEEGAGRVLFYYALPADGAFELALDVLTPHHKGYYEGDEPPTDWDSPEPFTFVTVVNTTFDVWLGARSSSRADRAALSRAAETLKQALEVSGVGGKTAAGYGRFDVEVKG